MYRYFAPFVFLMILAAACGTDSTEVSAGSDGEGDSPVTTAAESDDSQDTTDETSVDESVPDETLPDEGLPLGGGSYPVATFAITVTHPDHDDVTYEIACLGDTASVIPGAGDSGISEIAACSALGTDEVRARLIDGVPADQICTEQFGGPDVATVTGAYDGVDGIPVNATFDRSNGCGIDDWDNLMGDILPPSKGL